MTQILSGKRTHQELRKAKRIAEDLKRHLRKVLVHTELAMKDMNDLMSAIGDADATVDTTHTVNQGIVDDLDSQLDNAIAASDTTAAVDAVNALNEKAKTTVTSTHVTPPAPK